MNKEQLQQQIEEMKSKLAEMELELNKPKTVINYWQPECRDKYYFANHYGGIYEGTKNINGSLNRVFKTKEEAEKYAEYVKAEETLRRVIAEANRGWIPDFSSNYPKYYVILDNNNLKVDYWRTVKFLPSFVYIKNRQLANELVEKYEKEFRTYLSY